MMSTLSTHVLDTTFGVPAADVDVFLMSGTRVLFAGQTGEDGRCRDFPTLAPGRYRLEFDIPKYFIAKKAPVAAFFNSIVVDFNIVKGEGHYHVPIIVSPCGYTTYRGS